MPISYRPLCIQLASKRLKKTDLIRIAKLTTNVMANMGKEKMISIKNVQKICEALSCSPNEFFEFLSGEKGDNNEANY